MTSLGYNKIFILDKYFNELTKYWQREYDIQEKTKSVFDDGGNGISAQLQQLNNKRSNHKTTVFYNDYHHGHQQNNNTTIDDLIHLEAPVTEDSLVRALQSRFLNNQFFTNIGPVLVSLNPFTKRNNSLTLNSFGRHEDEHFFHLYRITHEAVMQQTETGYPQAIILSGESGSGKTYASMIILRQLFNLAGGGPETDAFKHLAAAITVLRSLGSAKTATNSESTRIGNFFEVQISDGAIYRTRIHCYFLDQSRVIRTPEKERNYHIFYQMLAGLTPSEKVKLYLNGYTISDFRFLFSAKMDFNLQQDAQRFEAWKSCLSVLGIPFMEIVRVLAAVLLIGNINFAKQQQQDDQENLENSNKLELNHISSIEKEVHAVACLLGISSASLYRGLVMRTINVHDQDINSIHTIENSESIRDALAKALYIRTVATIIRRANSSKRLSTSACDTNSSKSNDSNRFEISSSHHAPPSSIGSVCGKSYKTMAVLNNAIRYAMDGFIGILDIFGFEFQQPSRLEQLCINLCAETMQHFYNTHIFKSSIESCRDEAIQQDIGIDYHDNVPCIDLISSLPNGLFSLLDQECCQKQGSPELFVKKVDSIHQENSRYFAVTESNAALDSMQLARCFGIRHFTGNILYDTNDFLLANSDRLSSNIVSVFHKSQCSFGFVSHLFRAELRAMHNVKDYRITQRSIRIAPYHSDPSSSSSTTLTQDFHSRLDNLLRTLVHARPHFIRCMKINETEQCAYFDKFSLMKQIRALQILETVNLMAGGLPHRMRFKSFVSRYHVLVPSRHQLIRRSDEQRTIENCQSILNFFEKIQQRNPSTAALTLYQIGKKHVFLSENARQQLEMARNERRWSAAYLIQSFWRNRNRYRKQIGEDMAMMMPLPDVAKHQNLVYNSFSEKLKQKQPLSKNSNKFSLLMQQQSLNTDSLSKNFTIVNGHRSNLASRPQPIAGTPPLTFESSTTKSIIEMCDFNLIKETCQLLNLNLNITPLLPPCRQYTITEDDKKCYFPQIRSFKLDYTDPITQVHISKGQKVIALGFSNTKRGYLCIKYRNLNFMMPYQFIESLTIHNQNDDELEI